MIFDGRNRANAQKLRTGCSQHPSYKGKGAPPDPHCNRCHFMHEAWTELCAAVEDLLKE